MVQNLHKARFNIRGNVIGSHGIVDRQKAIKTKSDGRLHWSILDIYPILSGSSAAKSSFLDVTSFVQDHSSASMIVVREAQSDTKGNVLNAKNISSIDQSLIFSSTIYLDRLFLDWADDPISVEFEISDQALVDVVAGLRTSTGEITSKVFADMTKTVIGPGNTATVTFTFSKDGITISSGVAGIIYGQELSGVEYVELNLSVTLGAAQTIQLYSGSAKISYNAKVLQSTADDNWPAGQCGTCDMCDTCDLEACGVCDSCDVPDGCVACDVCDRGDE